MTDDLDAARAAVHDATPKGWFVGQRGLRLVVLTLVLAGCLSSSSQVPRAFTSYIQGMGFTFTSALPSGGTIPASEVLALLRGERNPDAAYLPGRPTGQPVFGSFGCTDRQTCGGVVPPGRPLAVWFVPYPGTPGAAIGGDAFALVDATTGEFIMGVSPP